jgi:hypothetical protein
MATIGEVGEVLCALSEKSLASVMLIGRILREAGHIKKGGRGRSARHLDSTEAAKFLVAATCADPIYEAANIVETVWNVPGAGDAIVAHIERPSSDLEIVYRPAVRIVVWRDMQPVQYGSVGDDVRCYYLAIVTRSALGALRDSVGVA